MAKQLVLEYNGKAASADLEKIDRSKLYGFIETIVTDGAGNPCELATFSGDTLAIAGKGDAALGYLSQNGAWRHKAELRAADPQGKEIIPVPSSFDAPIALTEEVEPSEYLAHNIRAFYLLHLDGEVEELKSVLCQEKKIFRFPFSYRSGLEASAGFLLAGADGNIFLCVGSRAAIEFVDLNMPPIEPDSEFEEESEDFLDFSLV